MSDPILERFHRALIEEIQTQRPEYLTGPFTVAEIYQNLVPYGSHRDRIGVEMNGDYEDALIRLLAGEGSFLVLDSEPALRNLRAELETANPNTGLYREFAAVDVRLNQAFLDLASFATDDLSDFAEEMEIDDPVAMAELAPTEGTSGDMKIVPPGVDIFSDQPMDAAPEPAAIRESKTTTHRPPLAPEFVDASAPNGSLLDESAVGAGSCAWCRADLPKRSNLNFCPFCGTDLALVPCAACGEEVEPTWRFCAACGTEADA